ncbi:MAG: HDIG domain-containing metalloprotein [candidate division WOR-3 bacterium]
MEELRNKALKLLEKYIKNENLKKHLFAVEALMGELAKKFGENEELWKIAGLVHDIDWELTKETPEKHSLLGAEILQKEGFPEEIVNAVKIHNHIHGFEPKTLLEKALYSCEEMTGFIVAVALVMPNKSLDEVTVERIMSKFKEPSFARGVNREIIKKCEELLGIKVEELAEICLNAMKKIRDKLGL